MRNNPDDLANQTLSKIKKICRKSIKNSRSISATPYYELTDGDKAEIEKVAKKELSQEILNLIKKEGAWAIH